MSVFFGPKRAAEGNAEGDDGWQHNEMYSIPMLERRQKTEHKQTTDEDLAWAYQQVWLSGDAWQDESDYALLVQNVLRTNGYDTRSATPNKILEIEAFQKARRAEWAKMLDHGDFRNNPERQRMVREAQAQQLEQWRHFNPGSNQPAS
jgi:hypothetical protein